ncbi:JAB domain-containing protein [Lacrimispora sphenoides]|uniref:DNA repair protein RadC n=1 Tax=Lacrimispora sphenoides JCM 1415 TaxID=1297793 RepID=A0ABY1C272_9FIRM|nr:JAB domain-containing protein [Lacrimispora sphenoides]SET55891.1 DNA repair protein RadC [[Clostridium] sphenoides JCM 1415]SUY49748.1 DNA repair proteins [Lacrimispora sphenoides]
MKAVSLIILERERLMKEKTQIERITDLMRKPEIKKRIGIVHLQMVKDSKSLCGLSPFTSPQKAVDMMRPLFEMSDREIVAVLSLNVKLEPMAVEIVAVGGISTCMVDVRNIFKHALLNNASYVICFHNHLSGDPQPSHEDHMVTERIQESGKLLGIPLLDHLIIGAFSFYSFKKSGLIEPYNSNDAA